MSLRYLDVCSGISAPTAAWKPLGWQALCFAEIEAAPRAVLSHHYPEVPLVGDFTQIEGNEYGTVELLVGGTPCQDFSVAGLRAGLAGERGNLSLQYLRLADRARPRWLVWENVPGVLSIDGGRAFGAILGGMVQLGYGIAYRVLDAQFFGVPQRRRRVFVVGHLGDWRRAAAVLFERHSLSGHPAPRREKGQAAPTIPSRSTAGGGLGTDFDCDGGLIADWPADVCATLDTYYGDKMGLEDQHVFNQGGSKFVPAWWPPEVADPVSASEGKTYTHEGLNFRTHNVVPVAFNITPSNSNKDYNARESDRAQALTAGGNRPSARGGDLIAGSAVRRLTPIECERLQGFPDNFTLVPTGKDADRIAEDHIAWMNRERADQLQPPMTTAETDAMRAELGGKWMADGPRYKMLGNSMAVPVIRWIGERIQAVEAIGEAERAAA